MRNIILFLLCTLSLHVSYLDASQNCFKPGVQQAGELFTKYCFLNVSKYLRAGPLLNDPTVDKTPDPESCQLFCQTVFECSDFSWADGDYSWEIYANG